MERPDAERQFRTGRDAGSFLPGGGPRTLRAMTDTTTLLIVALFLLIASSVLVGELFSQLGQAALVGQLLVGVILGPTLLAPYLGLTQLSSELSGLQFLATFFILLMSGLAVSPEQIWKTGLPAALLGLAVFLGPFFGGIGVVRLLYPHLPLDTALFIALTISITALPVLGVMLREFGLTTTRFGTFLLNGSVINELAAVTAFAILLRLPAHTSSGQEWIVGTEAVVTVGLFLVSVLAVHMTLRSLRTVRIWDRFVERFRATWHSREAGFALLMVMGLGAALYSQYLGLTFLVGAFYAGLLVTPESAGPREHRNISLVFDAITWGFFIPLFFALVGFGMNLRTLDTSVAALVAFSILSLYALGSKVLAGGGVARLLGWSGPESLCAGYLLTSRGAVELAMAVILLQDGIFNTELFTIVAGVGLVTTFISPIGARRYVSDIGATRRAPETENRPPPLSLWLPPKAEEDPADG